MHHVDAYPNRSPEDIELLVRPGCQRGLAGDVLRTLRQVLPPAKSKATTKTQGDALIWINWGRLAGTNPAGRRFVAMQPEPMAPEDLEDLLTRAARARRLARAILDDPMGLRIAQVADELDAELDRQTKIITGSWGVPATGHS